MDEVFGRVGGRFRISITDSTMMRILHCAMDKSHERAKSKEGFLERLNEISKFYQLAVIQLEGCLKFIQEETDHNGFESSDEEVLGDLTDIRDRLAGRLRESEIAISEKDRELKERLENEWKLRQALELKERKLDSLRKDLELERTKSEGIEELMLGNRLSVDEERDEEFSELKNSVDQQVWNIKQKLDPDYRLIDRRSNQNFDDIKIEQMSSDIDILKETMDLAFGKMHCAMILSELEPVERQWGWMIEKDVMAILFKGFMEDIHGNLEAEVGRREKECSIRLSNYLSDLERELYCLRTELEPVSTSQHSPERKNSLRAKGRSSSEEVPDNSTQMLEDDGDSHYVAKMIKNHESIIRRKSEETNSLKREIITERRRSSSREEKEPISPTRKIQNVFTVLDNLITWNAKLGGRLNHCGDNGSMEIHSKKLSSDLSKTEGKSQFDTLEDVWQKVNQNSVCLVADTEDLKSQISKLKMEKEEVNVRNKIAEMIYTTLLEGFMHDSRSELNCYSLKQAKSERLYEDSLKEMVKECNEQLDIHKIEFQNGEEIFYVVLGKVVNDFNSALNDALTESQHLRAKSNSLEDDVLEEKLKEEISRICFRALSNEWNEANEISETERLVKQEIYQIAFEETIRVIRNNANQMREVYLETLIREETFQLIILEAVKEVNTTCVEAEFLDHSGVLGKEKLFSAPTLYGIQGVSGGEIFTEKQDSLQNDDNKEKFMLNSSSETKECSEKHIAKDARVLLNEMKCSSTSACREIGKASEQIDMSKTILSMLRSSLNVRVEGIEKSDEINHYKSSFRNQTYFFQTEEKEELMNGFVYDKFLQAFLNFKSKVEERIEFSTLRLKKIMHHLNPMAELIDSLKTKEWLYRKAFIRRCENLRKAEIEVDLLGDQVELLLDLLEKIYKRLRHHSPALGQYFDVSEILTMIEEGLGGVHASSK